MQPGSTHLPLLPQKLGRFLSVSWVRLADDPTKIISVLSKISLPKFLDAIKVGAN
jgi:hypothetical protein